jgi:Cu-Zn family superoxide dismutase
MRPLLAIFAPLILSACSGAGQPVDKSSTAAPSVTPTPVAQPAPVAQKVSAQATLAPTEGNRAAGVLTVEVEAQGLRVRGELQGLASSAEHGFHIHEKGDCSAPDASSAGGHFNPSAKSHGKPDGGDHHAGDMFNVIADAQGTARVDALVAGVTLRDGSATDVAGKAIVLHEKADDYTSQPAGDSGKRIACGVIQ